MRFSHNGVLFLLVFLCGCQSLPTGPLVGEGEHTYHWDTAWPELTGRDHLGSTHGAIAIDGRGRIYISTDTEDAIMVFSSDGTLLDRWGGELGAGVHGVHLVREGEEEFLYLCHLKNELIKATLDGEIVWRLGTPKAHGLYDLTAEKIPYHPTGVAVAPNGDIYIADGYGKFFIHQYTKERVYVRSFGGRGTEFGKLRNPHGILVDTRGDAPVLVVADRGNSRLHTFSLTGEPLKTYGEHFRLPCSIAQRGDQLVVADLKGRVTILEGEYELVTHLGDNPDESLRGQYGVPPEKWVAGHFIAPHYATWDDEGNLYVEEWNKFGRVVRLVAN